MLLREMCIPDMRDTLYPRMAAWPISQVVESDTPQAQNAERGASQMKWKTKMLGTVVNKLRSYRKYQETYRELSRLTSRELADLGISRSEISSVARKASV